MKFSAKSRFTAIMVITASIAMMLVGALAWFEGRHSLEDAEFIHLSSVRVAKVKQVENYFEQMQNQLTLMSEDRTVIEAVVQLSRGYRLLGETLVPDTYDSAIKAHYERVFMPALDQNLLGGVPDFETFRPKSQPGRYLQYHYMVNAPATPKGDKVYAYSDAEDGSLYSEFHAAHHKGLSNFMITYGFHDIFLIDFDSGEIIYSASKEVDFGTNLLNGPYRNTGLADVTRNVMKDPVRGQVQIVDFAPYAPSYNVPASFMAAPIYNGQHVVGILAFQVPVDRLQDIMTNSRKWRDEGLGESGETYIIGSDLMMRTNSRFLIEQKEDYFKKIKRMGLKDEVIELIDRLNTTILLQPVRTEGARAALRGETGHFIAKNYRGISVLSTYSPLDIDGLNWGIVSEIDQAEAFLPVGRLLRRILISTAIFIPIVAYLSFILSQSFLRPVQSLIDTAREMRKTYDADDYHTGDQLKFEAEGASEYIELSSEMNTIMSKVREDMIETRNKQLEYTNLITSTLPLSVAERFRSGERDISDEAKMATVLFIQTVNFDDAETLEDMARIMSLQNELDDKAHAAAHELGVDLFNQVGMEFVAICGLTMPYLNHFERTMKFAMRMFAIVDAHNKATGEALHINVGLDTGPLFGALNVGDMLDYDIIGDSVYACREAGYIGPDGGITITDRTHDYLKKLGLKYDWVPVSDTIIVGGATYKLLALPRDKMPISGIA